MSHIVFTLLAYFLNSVAVLIDKFLLTKHIPNPIVYVFYFSVFSMLALLILPFTPLPTFSIFFIASVSTLIWTTGAYFMYKALQVGQASRVIPVIGTLSPLTLIFYYGLLTRTISPQEIAAVLVLTIGLVLLTISHYKGRLIAKEFIYEVLAAILFAFSYVILREAYQLGEHLLGPRAFLTVLAWSRVILIPVGAIILLIPTLRKTVLTTHGPQLSFSSVKGRLFFAGQFLGGISEILLTYSVYLANPAVVNSLQGTQYVFIFIFSLFLARRFPDVFEERVSRMILVAKLIGICLIVLGLYLLFVNTETHKLTKHLTLSTGHSSIMSQL